MKLCKYGMLVEPIFKNILRSHSVNKCLSAAYAAKSQKVYKIPDCSEDITEEFFRSSSDKRILFNSYIQSYEIRATYGQKKYIMNQMRQKESQKQYDLSIPLCVETYVAKKENTTLVKSSCVNDPVYNVSFPFDKYDEYHETIICSISDDIDFSIPSYTTKEDIAFRLKTYNELKQSAESLTSNKAVNIFEDNVDNNQTEYIDLEKMNYGTSDPKKPASHVSCGGCGALLHCQDDALPGYIPSEAFSGASNTQLRSMLCQRCYFLKYHNMALNVRVPPSMYIDALQPIKETKALILVVLDVFDVPCSIWPGISELLGSKRPVVVIGNKIDLLPPDGPDFLKSVEQSFVSTIEKTDLWNTNIKHITLVSAKTGYGIENLITKIQDMWENAGDIYILGCTNAGKSSLFNALLGSDLCQIKAADLVKKATASPWPGTTLNLLKFPLLRPTGQRIHRRQMRLQEVSLKSQRDALDTNSAKSVQGKNFHLATLKGHIGQTFRYDFLKNTDEDSPYLLTDERKIKAASRVGIYEKSRHFRYSRWCYDTPGTVQPDQLLCLLTHEELLKVIPKAIIEPRTFSIKSGETIFIAGLSRLDLVYSHRSLRFTVFASPDLPITIVKTVDAASVYRDFLGTSFFAIPIARQDRLKSWKPLKPRNIFLTGKGMHSTADVVLSSSGFVAVTGFKYQVADLRAWTPSGRGIYVRDPPMLPASVTLKGKAIKESRAFGRHSAYIPEE